MSEQQEQRHIYFDRDLEIEAYHLKGIVQKESGKVNITIMDTAMQWQSKECTSFT